MKMDDLDRILSSEELLEPSSGFATEVMSRLQSEAAALPAIPFPWGRFVFAFAMLAVQISLAVRLVPAAFFDCLLHRVTTAWDALLADPTLHTAVLSASLSLVGALLLVWFSFWLVADEG
jgi:hypothetical protein